MSITEKDINISNQSYTNKDFDSIYTELVSLAKKISYKYDPTVSNESDPFIVLLKLLAFIGDKTNYNVDKNILERFMPSATQESSMNDLTARMGYNMHYYKTATTSVIFKYNYPEDYYNKYKNSDSSYQIKIPKFAVIENDTKDIQYVTLADAYINVATGLSSEIKVKQGVKNELTVLNNAVIQLENLDENNRLYFSETRVAQNGVFIEGGIISESYMEEMEDGYWLCVDNLNTQEYNKPCFVFRYDSSKKLPYIEFPEWINNIIGSGLTIYYLICDGVEGNVYAKALTSVNEFKLDDIANSELTKALGNVELNASDISVINYNAATNGQDPETLDEAYNGFKKTIGTFDTLVTCRDYANAIYNMLESETESNLVSNVQVADRRDDINYSLPVVGYDKYGVNTVSRIPEKDVNDLTKPIISAFDLCLYPLDATLDPTDLGDTKNTFKGFKETFTRPETTDNIRMKLEEAKTISHDYKDLKTGDIYLIKNYYNVDAIITTSTKVNSLEESDIVKNVKKSLAKKFNSRELEYGYEIPFDLLLSTIENADARIKSVSLKEPEQTTKIMPYNETNINPKEIPIYDSDGQPSTAYKFIVGKNVYAGKISLFNYDERFEYTYGQKKVEVIDNVKTITSEANIEITTYTYSTPTEENSYLLNDNEVIQFIAPKYTTDVTYPYGVDYYLELEQAANQKLIESLTYNSSTFELSIKYKDSSKQESYTDVYSFEGKTTQETMLEQVQAANNKLEFDLVRFVDKTKTSKYTQSVNFSANNNQYIPADCHYTLKNGDTLIFKYTNTADEEITKIYGAGDIVKCNVNLYTSKYRKASRSSYSRGETPTQIVGDKYYYTLSSNQQVDHESIVSDTIKQGCYVYWQVNDVNNTINWIKDKDNNYYYVLADNEYFFVTDIQRSNLLVYESGTKLVITEALHDWQQSWSIKKIDDISTVIQSGLQALSSYFIYMGCSESATPVRVFEAIQQNIVTLTSNDFIFVKSSSSTTWKVTDNEFNDIPDGYEIYYKIDGEESFTKLPSVTNNENKWKARGILDINAGPEIAQTVVNKQKITIKYKDSEGVKSKEIASGKTFRFTILEQLAGGKDIDLEYNNILTGESVYPSIEIYELIATSDIKASNLKHYYGIDFSNAKSDTLSPLILDESLAKLYFDINYGTAEMKSFLDNFNENTKLATWKYNDKSSGLYVNIVTSGSLTNKLLTNTTTYNATDSKIYYAQDDISQSGGKYISKGWNTKGKDNGGLESDGSLDIRIDQTNVKIDSLSNIKGWNGKWLSKTSISKTTEALYLPNIDNNKLYILIFPTLGASDEAWVKASIDKGNLINYSTGEPARNHQIILAGNKMNLLEISNGEFADDKYSYIKFQTSSASHKNTLIISDPRIVKDINSLLGLGNTTLNEFTTFLKDENIYGKAFEYFYATSYIDNAKAIEVSENYPLNDPLSFYDYNNIANKWVLPVIDLDESDIRIAKSSKK